MLTHEILFEVFHASEFVFIQHNYTLRELPADLHELGLVEGAREAVHDPALQGVLGAFHGHQHVEAVQRLLDEASDHVVVHQFHVIEPFGHDVQAHLCFFVDFGMHETATVDVLQLEFASQQRTYFPFGSSRRTQNDHSLRRLHFESGDEPV